MTKVAIIQARPAYYDLAASLSKAEALIKEAAGQGAELVTFGETWLPGYPAWLDVCPNMGLWDHAPTKAVFGRLYENSVIVPSPVTERLGAMARAAGVVLVMSINERVGQGRGHGTLYNTLLTFNSDGMLVNRHRKLVPTYTERLVWGHSDDPSSLHAVDTSVGRVGGLTCWEHWMPLTRQALHESHEDIHIAVWPTVKEMLQIASRHYAFEGRCYVLAAGCIMPASDLPAELDTPADLTPDTLVLRGGSAIIAPDGSYVAGPVYDEETILCAEIDLSMIPREKMALDVTGHYSRPDVFDFKVKGI